MSKHYTKNPTGNKIPNFQQFTCINVNFNFVTSFNYQCLLKAFNFTFTFFFQLNEKNLTTNFCK